MTEAFWKQKKEYLDYVASVTGAKDLDDLLKKDRFVKLYRNDLGPFFGSRAREVNKLGLKMMGDPRRRAVRKCTAQIALLAERCWSWQEDVFGLICAMPSGIFAGYERHFLKSRNPNLVRYGEGIVEPGDAARHVAAYLAREDGEIRGEGQALVFGPLQDCPGSGYPIRGRSGHACANTMSKLARRP